MKVYKQRKPIWGMMGIDKNEIKPTRNEFRKDLMSLAKYIKDTGDMIEDGVNLHTNYFLNFGLWGMFGSNCRDHLCYLVEESMGFPFGKVKHSYSENDVFMTTKTKSISEDGKSRQCSTITTTYALEKENNNV